MQKQLLDAASSGDLLLLKKLVSELEVEDGLAETIASIRNNGGSTALHVAAAKGKTHVCKYLVEEVKLDVDRKNDISDETPLHCACFNDHYLTAEYLVENCANLNAMAVHWRKRTPLHCAAERGSKRLIKLLVSKGADLNAVAEFGTPLLVAALRSNKDCIEILLDNHVDPNVIDHDLFSPLTASIGAQSIECVKLLLGAGADPNISCLLGMTPLGFAASRGSTEIIHCLLNAGADPNVTDNLSGVKPVEEAAFKHNHEAVMILLPLTSPIPTISDWSYAGILRHACSKEAIELRRQHCKKYMLFSKSKAEEHFNMKDYLGAFYWYSKVHVADPYNVDVLSNRSLCGIECGYGEAALEDALICIMLRPDWPKAHYCAGVAFITLGDFEKAADAFYDVWKLDLEDKDLERAFCFAMEMNAKHDTMHSSELENCLANVRITP
ncbi:hypothetical protein SLE2022_245950 [Rubroshorea leprosula]